MTRCWLQSVGPKDLAEDEQRIGKYYASWRTWLVAIIPVSASYFYDLKWTVAVGVATLVGMLIGIEMRLFELCIRVRRANETLRELRTDNAAQSDQLKRITEHFFHLSYGFGIDKRAKQRSDTEWDDRLRKFLKFRELADRSEPDPKP